MRELIAVEVCQREMKDSCVCGRGETRRGSETISRDVMIL